MNELKTEMQERWNTHADTYDSAHAHGVSSPAEQERWNKLFAGKQGASLLDVGCGTGFVSLVAARAGLRVTGVDWSEGMMEKAKQKAAEEGLDIQFACSATENLPFAEERFQILTARNVMWTLTEPVSAFREWYRVLAPGGCVMADYAPRKGAVEAHHYRLEVEQQLPLNRDVAPEVVAAMLQEAGFAKVEIREHSYAHPDLESGEMMTHTNYLFIAQKHA